MVLQYPVEQAQPIPEHVMQQSIIEQAQAAAAGQTNPTTATRQEDSDLVTPDATENDVPPPAYGDTYGEIRNEKNGLGTNADVAEDGRVNININRLNWRLSQIFTPALRQQNQSAKDSSPPPPPYVPPSLGGGEDGVPPPPRLNIVIQVVGSRGDVQPFVALGKVLKDTYGHRVRLATHPNFKDFVQENGLEFFSIGGDPSRLMAFMVKNAGLMPGFRSLFSGDISQRRREVGMLIQGCWRSCYEAGDGRHFNVIEDDVSELSGSNSNSDSAARPFVADCIIANPPSFAHIHCAEKLGIPLHIMFTMPYSPTQAFPHPLANIQSSNADPQVTNFISYAMIELLSWQGLGDIINRFRKKCLGLDPVSLIWGPGMLQRLKVPHTYCWSPALIPKPKDWGPHISVSGFYLLNSPGYMPAPDLQAFLEAGPTPVYIGFGSIVLKDPDAMTELIFKAVRKTGQRVLLSKGWGGMGAEHIPENVFMLGNVPHDWLFKHVSCVVHHGGAGTTAAGITAGRPTVVVSFFGDQAFWGSMVARAGAGPDPIPVKQLTADRLADAINFCLKPESLERAKELASKIALERGSDEGVQSFHQHLEIDKLRCTLVPSRPAVWRIKRTQVTLSAFAACTLANANLLDFHDLVLFRPREYYTDEGPLDPISGGFTAACSAFSSMALGLAEVPTETLKTFHMPSKSNRQQSQTSVSNIAEKSESLYTMERPTSPASTDQRQTELVPIGKPYKVVGSSSSTFNTDSNASANRSHTQTNDQSRDASRVRVRSRVEHGSKDLDMLRHTGAHMSKGFGRFVRTLVQSPMDVSVSLTKGWHNVPKLWGDDTVRPQERITGFKSGLRATGREFGFGWYDGLTGLVTQPMRGAQKEGTAGFLKGLGKGVGGFLAKPGAACFGVLSHTMKGVHKEVQNMFGSNLQNHIIASRAAQGYEEWLQSSDTETQDVVARWKLIQRYLKKKGNSDEMLRDILQEQRKPNLNNREAPQTDGHILNVAQSAESADTTSQSPESIVRSRGNSQSTLSSANIDTKDSHRLAESDDEIQVTNQERLDVDMHDKINHENPSQRQGPLPGAASHRPVEEDSLRQAMTASEVENQRHASEALEFEKQLKQVMAQSLKEQQQSRSDGECEDNTHLNYEEAEEAEQGREKSKTISRKAVPVAGGSRDNQQPPSYDPGHLAGITQAEFDAQQHGKQREKTMEEKTEEDIVVEYIKKQSLLETYHQNKTKGKGRATAVEEEDDEDLRRALELSMHSKGSRHDEASRF